HRILSLVMAKLNSVLLVDYIVLSIIRFNHAITCSEGDCWSFWTYKDKYLLIGFNEVESIN
ncbi:predicted protein, partial [Arabidopsis lyrata subsp. lyrata]